MPTAIRHDATPPPWGEAETATPFRVGVMLSQRKAILAAFKRIDDLPRDRSRIAQRIRVPETQDSVTLALQPCVSRMIMSRLRAIGMMTAVKFDDKLCFEADKIGVVGSERVLTTELPAMIPLGAQISPKRALGRRCVFPKIARAFVSQAFPHPKFSTRISASPQGGDERRMTLSWPS